MGSVLQYPATCLTIYNNKILVSRLEVLFVIAIIRKDVHLDFLNDFFSDELKL